MLIRACTLNRTNMVVELLKYKVVDGVNLRVDVGGVCVYRQAERNEDAEHYYQEAAKLRPKVSYCI